MRDSDSMRNASSGLANRLANRVVAPVLFALWIGMSPASAAPPADIDSFAARVLSAFETPAMSVSIVEESGAVAFVKGYGVRKLGEPAKLDEHTIMPIASNTKAFTAAALALLVDEGKLNWDGKVGAHLADFAMYDPYVTREITVRDLLTHRSGLGGSSGALLMFPRTSFSRDELVARMRFITPATSFRSRFGYNNLHYVAAGQIIEKISGRSYESFLRERIFEPLAMQDAVASFGAVTTVNRAWPHARSTGVGAAPGEVVALPGIEEFDNIAAAGGVHVSAADMAAWLTVQLNEGRIAGSTHHLFSEDASREMWRPQIAAPTGPAAGPFAPAAPTFSFVAMGWAVFDYRGHTLIGHTGALSGARSTVVLAPQKRLGLAVTINSEEGGAVQAMVYRLLDYYLGLEPIDWITRGIDGRREAEARSAVTRAAKPSRPAGEPGAARDRSLPLSTYANVYTDPMYGSITIRARDGRLEISFDHTPGMIGVLEHEHRDTFRVHWTGAARAEAFVTFWLKPDGSIDQARMQAVSPSDIYGFRDLILTPKQR